ncbi:unnamed protein product [Thlaspi arvense]|uniref:Pentatricopeptide repeat-containing protein n=1 Tax=Thlaspi arvense TaxID=13288 RepID=A0AAU9SEQ2_THLAR|nr:unnamed protein product [Thlaspi arvense]
MPLELPRQKKKVHAIVKEADLSPFPSSENLPPVAIFPEECSLRFTVKGIVLLSMCVRCGSARKVFDKMSQRNVVPVCSSFTSLVRPDIGFGDWNTMIAGSLRNDKVEEGLMLYRSMLMSGVDPTQFTYSMVLNACSKLGSYSLGKLIHSLSDSSADLRVENALLDMYCSCGLVGISEPEIFVNWDMEGVFFCSKNGEAESAQKSGIQRVCGPTLRFMSVCGALVDICSAKMADMTHCVNQQRKFDIKSWVTRRSSGTYRRMSSGEQSSRALERFEALREPPPMVICTSDEAERRPGVGGRVTARTRELLLLLGFMAIPPNEATLSGMDISRSTGRDLCEDMILTREYGPNCCRQCFNSYAKRRLDSSR